MPGEPVNGRQEIHSPRFSDVIVPTDYGSMAVIDEKGEKLDGAIGKISKTIVQDI